VDDSIKYGSPYAEDCLIIYNFVLFLSEVLRHNTETIYSSYKITRTH